MTEVPPGPPVLSTMVAEIYGPDLQTRARAGAPGAGHLRVDARHRGRGLVGRGSAARRSSSRSTGRRPSGAGITPEVVVRTCAWPWRAPRPACCTRRTRPASRCPSGPAHSTAPSAPASMALLGACRCTAPEGRMVPLASWSRSPSRPQNAVHLPQEPAPRDLRDRPKWRATESPDLRHPRHEGRDRRAAETRTGQAIDDPSSTMPTTPPAMP